MAADTALVTASISTDGHDGTIYDPEPDDPTVHDATDDGACDGIDANDAAVVDDGAATADDGANGAIVSHGAAAAIGLTANTVGLVRTTETIAWRTQRTRRTRRRTSQRTHLSQ